MREVAYTTTTYFTVPKGLTDAQHIADLCSMSKVDMIQQMSDFGEGSWQSLDDEPEFEDGPEFAGWAERSGGSTMNLQQEPYMRLSQWALLVSSHKDEILARVAATFDRELHGDDYWFEHVPNIDINVWIDDTDTVRIMAYPIEGCNTRTNRWVVLK